MTIVATIRKKRTFATIATHSASKPHIIFYSACMHAWYHLLKDFLNADFEFEFVQAKRTLMKLKVVEIAGVLVGLISATLKQWPLSNCSLLPSFSVAAAPDQAYTVLFMITQLNNSYKPGKV